MERFEQAEIDVHRLIGFRLRIAGNVGKQGAHGRAAGRRFPEFSSQLVCGHDTGDQPDGRTFDITFATGDLASKADMLCTFQPELPIKHHRRVDEGVAVQPTQTREFRILKAGDGAEEFDLCAVFQLGLETDHVPQRTQLVVLPQLDNGMGPATLRKLRRGIAWVVEADGLHRAEAQRVDAA